MKRHAPCECHLSFPCVIYSPGNPEYDRIENSHFYTKETCPICDWRIAKTIARKATAYSPVKISGNIQLPTTLKLKFNTYIDYKKVISKD